MNKEYIEVETIWYHELVRTKAKWDLLIDTLLHDNYPDFCTEEVNYWVNSYYSQLGVKPPEECVGPEEIVIKEKAKPKRKPLKITEEGRK